MYPGGQLRLHPFAYNRLPLSTALLAFGPYPEAGARYTVWQRRFIASRGKATKDVWSLRDRGRLYSRDVSLIESEGITDNVPREPGDRRNVARQWRAGTEIGAAFRLRIAHVGRGFRSSV